MSISPPRWGVGSIGSGSHVGSLFGTSFGREREGRERDLEAKYVKDFACCGRQLNGLHDLLEQ
jgi:transcription factor SFP1